MDKTRVIHTKWTYSIIDTDIPKATKISLLCFTTNISICTSFHDSIFCSRIDVSIHSAISFCKSEDTFMSFVGHHTTFYTSHRGGGLELYEYWEIYLRLFSIREWKSAFKLIRIRNNFSIFITTFCFWGFILEKVTFCRFIENEFSCSSDFYTFFCARVSLEFHGIRGYGDYFLG